MIPYFGCRINFQSMCTSISSKSHRWCILPPGGSRCFGLWALNVTCGKKENSRFPVFFKTKKIIIKEQTQTLSQKKKPLTKEQISITHNLSDYSITMILNHLLSSCTFLLHRVYKETLYLLLWPSFSGVKFPDLHTVPDPCVSA